MDDKKYAEKQVYRVMIDAPIDRVWSELVATTAPRPFFWNSNWDTREMAAGNAYRMVSNNGKTVAVIGKILEMDPPHRLVHSFRLTALPDPPSQVTYMLKERRRHGVFLDHGTSPGRLQERKVHGPGFAIHRQELQGLRRNGQGHARCADYAGVVFVDGAANAKVHERILKL